MRTPMLLVLLSLVPLLGGVARLVALADVAVTPATERFVSAPGPIAVHVVVATVYSIVGAFQFSPQIRRRWPRWHRWAGRVLALFGLVAGATGTWLAAATAIPTALQGPLLQATRLIVGPAMVLFVVLGVRAILRRDVRAHEGWMIRAYALGQGAGTQALLLGPPAIIAGEVLGFPRDVLMTLAWGINALVAEWLIRSPKAVPGAVPQRG